MPIVLQTPSLQHLARVKIVTCLWTQPDIFTQIAQSFSYLPAIRLNQYEHMSKEFEDQVDRKIWALPLPEICKEELLNVVKPIGMEIISWCQYHNLDVYTFQSLPRQLCWSMHGTVEYKKTAELMVKDARLSVEKHFEFACLNCLEEEARLLINFIPNRRLLKYLDEAGSFPWEFNARILVPYFTCSLTGNEDSLNKRFQRNNWQGLSINQYVFQVVLCNGPRATCEYFFRKVSQAEKEQVYFQLSFRPPQSPTCGLMYCLSLLNEEQQQRMFQESRAVLLVLLLRWPMQSLFVETAKRAWQLMGAEECAAVLSAVITKIRTGLKDYDYAQLFWELWRSSPAEHTLHFLDDIYRLEHLIATKRKEFIHLVFNEAPAHLLNEIVERQNYFYNEFSRTLMDEGVISDAALMECKKRAALISSTDRDNEEKRQRSQHLSRLVDLVMERRINSRENAELVTSRLISIGRVTRRRGDGEKSWEKKRCVR